MVYFSKIIDDPDQTDFKINAIIAYVDGKETHERFREDYNKGDNSLYYRFKNFGLKEIDIINIQTKDIEEKNRKFEISIPFINKENTIISSSKYSLRVYNLKSTEFFNQDTISNLLNDKSRNYLFFFKGISWKMIVKEFYLSGFIVSGGSTNQRHIFSELHFNMTLLLCSLFGLNFAYEMCDYMVHKDSPYASNQKLYSSEFNYNSKENTLYRLFNKVADKGKTTHKISKFLKISQILFGDAINLGKSILPWELLRVWILIASINDQDTIYALLTNILQEIDKETDEKIILENLKKNFSFLKENLESPSNSPQNTVIEKSLDLTVKEKQPSLYRPKNVAEARKVFMYLRFHPESKKRYTYYPYNIAFWNPFVIPKK